MRHIDPRATAALFGAIVCWSAVPLFLKYFTGYIDGWTSNGIRYPFAAIILLPWILHEWHKGHLRRKVFRAAIVPAAINFVGQVLWAWTPYYIDPGLMAFLVRISILWAVLGSFVLFYDERRLIKNPVFWTGFVLVVAGFIFMSFSGKVKTADISTFLTGIILVFFTGIFWAGYQVSVRKYMSEIDSRTAFGVISSYTAVGLLLVMFLFGNPREALEAPVSVQLLILLSGLIGITGAHTLFYVAVKRIGVAIASSSNLLSAFITAFFSFFLFNERLSLVQWFAGIGLVIGSLFLVRAQKSLINNDADKTS
jgi:drug/metabolite transporter (DMT)-like permease